MSATIVRTWQATGQLLLTSGLTRKPSIKVGKRPWQTRPNGQQVIGEHACIAKYAAIRITTSPLEVLRVLNQETRDSLKSEPPSHVHPLSNRWITSRGHMGCKQCPRPQRDIITKKQRNKTKAAYTDTSPGNVHLCPWPELRQSRVNCHELPFHNGTFRLSACSGHFPRSARWGRLIAPSYAIPLIDSSSRQWTPTR